MKRADIESNLNSHIKAKIFNRKQLPLTESQRNSMERKSKTFYEPQPQKYNYLIKKPYKLTMDEQQSTKANMPLARKQQQEVETQINNALQIAKQKYIRQNKKIIDYSSQKSQQESSLILEQKMDFDEKTSQIKFPEMKNEVTQKLNLLPTVIKERSQSTSESKQAVQNTGAIQGQQTTVKKSNMFDYQRLFKRIQLPNIFYHQNSDQQPDYNAVKVSQMNFNEFKPTPKISITKPELVKPVLEKKPLAQKGTIETYSQRQKLLVGEIKLNRYYNYLQEYNKLKQIELHLKQSNLLQTVKSYVEQITKSNENYFEYLVLDLHQERIIKKCVLLSRISVLCIMLTFSVDSFAKSLNYISNLIRYSILNLVHFLGLNYKRISKMTTDVLTLEQILPIIHESKLLPEIRIFEKIKNNSQIMWQAIVKITKDIQPVHNRIKNQLKTIQKQSIYQKSTKFNLLITQFLHQQNIAYKLPFMATPFAPYLTAKPKRLYTLIIDLYQVFLYQKRNEILVRPFCREFLTEISRNFEIVISSKKLPNQVDNIINNIDDARVISYRLYKYHLSNSAGLIYLDLFKLGRNMNSIITLTSEKRGSNNIYLKSWKGNITDTGLKKITKLLLDISTNYPQGDYNNHKINKKIYNESIDYQ